MIILDSGLGIQRIRSKKQGNFTGLNKLSIQEPVSQDAHGFTEWR